MERPSRPYSCLLEAVVVGGVGKAGTILVKLRYQIALAHPECHHKDMIVSTGTTETLEDSRC